MKGLSEIEAQSLQDQFGKNILHINDTKRFFNILRDVVKEPMFLLLAAAGVLYFVLGDGAEGFMMVLALCFVAAISILQEIKSSHAMEALRQLTEPKVKVIRDGVQKEINVEDLVPGDIILLEEGNKIPADAQVIEGNDLSVNESILSGESLPVEKNMQEGANLIFQGTVINSGRCTARVLTTGDNTSLGKIGQSIMTYTENKTELQKQVSVFVKRFALFGIVAFFVIFFINYLHNNDIIISLLYGLTLAMSAIPEEIPVTFSSFMALGAYRMSKLGIISRQPQTIENLGAVNIICLDKTGTITENKMSVDEVYDFESNSLLKPSSIKPDGSNVLFYGVLASEKNPFDAMETAILKSYQDINHYLPGFKMIGEYPLGGHPPMMTHVFDIDGTITVAAKGAVERIIRIAKLPEDEAQKILGQAKAMASKGHRVLGVASAIHSDAELPSVQDDFNWQFKGLISFYDPPRTFISEVFKQFYTAGITVKLITGDYPETAITIANETELRHNGDYITGEEVMKASDEEIKIIANRTNIFARMYPEAKLKVVQALIDEGNIVAMTGDGVNDGPALKAANIGIALGQKGTEVARQSADLIITDDDLKKVPVAITQGRKIFANLKKAVRYIISIHIPIVLTASLPLIFGWMYPNIFTPIHVIFLELIMGPTCSIFFEREPTEEYIMKLEPRKKDTAMFTTHELLISIAQGLMITIGILALYYFYSAHGSSLQEVRTIVFTTLLFSNIFLTFIDRSFSETILKTIHYKNGLAAAVLITSLCFIVIIHTVPFVRDHFGMSIISIDKMAICFITALVNVGWFELYKANLKPVDLFNKRKPKPVL